MKTPDDDMTRDEVISMWYELKQRYDDLREIYQELKEHIKWVEMGKEYYS